MRGSRVLVAGLVIVLAVAASCSGERQTPTAPQSVVRLNFHLETSGSVVIQKAKLTLDGRDVATVSTPEGRAQVAFDVTVPAVAHGTHTMGIVVLEQTSSPTWYIAGGAVMTEDRVLDLAPVQGTLQTGGSLEFRTTF